MSTPLDSFEDKNREQPPASEGAAAALPPVQEVAEETTLPPEAQGETNGGPLGCCLGTIVGLLLSSSIALISRAYFSPLQQLFGDNLSIITRVLMILLAIIAMLVCGNFGWRLGKFAYREYKAPIVKERRRRSSKKAKNK